jgi:signal transduction histidine kinase
MKNLFLLLFFLQISSVAAQTNVPIVKWVNSDVGLKQLSISGYAVDNNGFVWIGTALGLYRYNWNKAQLVEHPKYKNISKQRILHLYKDDETGIIYFRTEAEQKMYSIKNNAIHQVNDAVGIILNNFFLKSNHPMFAAIVKYNGERAAYDEKHYPYNEDAILTSSYYCIRNSNSFDMLYPNGSYKTIDFPGAQKTQLMTFKEAIFVLGKENIKVIKDGKLAQEKITGDKVINDFMSLDKKRGGISLVNGSCYINFKNIIYKIQYDAIKSKLYATFLFRSPVNINAALAYYEAADVYLLRSNNKGMAVVKPNAFNVIYTQENNYNRSDYVVVKKGDKWYNCNGWIYDTTLKKTENRFINNYKGMMRFLLECEGDYFYQAKNNELLSIIDLKTKAPFKNDLKLTRLVGFTYIDKTLWLANQKNCAYLHSNKWVFDTIVSKAIRSNQNINAISAKGDQLIFATSQGVFLHNPFSDDISYIKGLENVNARYIKHIDKSSFWVGCYGDGLFLVRNKIAYKVVDSTIDIPTIHAIEEDLLGNLWISTNNGLLTVSKQKAIANTLKGKPIECYLYTVSDGLPTDEFNGGSTFPSLKNADGTIGFPSMKGFVYFNPKNIKKHLFSGAIVLDQVLVDAKIVLPIKTDSYNIDSSAEVISLKMDYGYSGNTENLSFFYKFEDQTQWTAFKQKTIVMPRYKKGTQQLQIKIKTHGFDAKDDVIRSFSLHFEPRFYETIWFWILMSIILLLLILFSYLFGNYYRKIRERNLKKIIDQNNIDLRESNETLQQTFSIISHDLRNPFNALLGYATLLVNNFDNYSDDKKMIQLKMIRSAAEINYNLTQNLLSWSLRQHQGYKVVKSTQSLQDVIEHVVVSLSAFTELKNAMIEITIPNKMVFIDDEIVAVILNNILTNAIKFSSKNTIIKISSSLNESQLCISVSNNGPILADEKIKAIIDYLTSVVNEDNPRTGFGLQIAKEMALLHNGYIEFRSENGATEVTVVINLDKQ